MRGLGIDVCEIARIEKAIRDNEHFLSRYYTAEERDYLQKRGNSAAQSAAAMFAAKEAFLKALGMGLSGGVAMREIGISHSEGGCPAYALQGKAKEMLAALGANTAFLSLTHDAGVAVAVCVLE